VASDSDYTRLASRIREQGLFVYGFGDRKTPMPLVTACDRFIYSDILVEPVEGETSKTLSGKTLRSDTKLVTLLRDAVDSAADDVGWAYLGGVGQHISNVSPSFDARNYGYQKLGELISAIGLFEIDNRPVEGQPGNKTIYIRHKPRRSRSKRSTSSSK
jgi:hypothetical protein